MRIAIIDPVARDTSHLSVPTVEGVSIERKSLRWGTPSIESRWDDDLAAPGVIDAAIRAELDGACAIVVNCMDDPGVDAAREVVRIPVVGPAHAAMQLALCLATRFTILTTAEADVPIVNELIARYQLEHRAARVRSLGLGVNELTDDADATFAAAVEAAELAVADGAGALIAGCTLLGPHLTKPGTMLSAGTRRKVWLAGAFASGAAVTLLDEPFAALDKASIGFVLELLDDAAASSTRAWVVADYEAPRGVPLAAEVDLGD